MNVDTCFRNCPEMWPQIGRVHVRRVLGGAVFRIGKKLKV